MPRHETASYNLSAGLLWVRRGTFCILVFSLVAKLPLLAPDAFDSGVKDGLLGVSSVLVTALASLAELSVLLVLWKSRSFAVRGLALCWLGGVFCLYHLARWQSGSSELCPCLSGIAMWFPAASAALTQVSVWLAIAIFVSGLVLLGGAGEAAVEPAQDHAPALLYKRINPMLTVLVASLLTTGFLTVAVSLPFGDAVELGGDEHYELMKGTLVDRGHVLYGEVWSDQPPLFTSLVSAQFRFFGEAVAASRWMVLGFATLLVFSLAMMTTASFGTVSGAVAVFVFVTGPLTLLLSVSVMQQIPMLSLSLLSCWIGLSVRSDRLHWPRALASGVVMGLALGIKLMAGVFAAALILSWCCQTVERRESVGILIKHWTAFFLGVAIMLLILFFFHSRATPLQILRPHFQPALVLEGLERPEDYQFGWWVVVPQFTTALLALLGGFSTLLGRWPDGRPWFFLMAGVLQLILGFWHRPWWGFYQPDFTLGLALVSAVGAHVLLCKQEVRMERIGVLGFTQLLPRQALGVFLLLAIAMQGIYRGSKEYQRILYSEKRASSQMVAKLADLSEQGDWAYSVAPIHLVHAGLLMPPELAVVSLKRQWAGQIDRARIVEVLRRYEPVLLVMRNTREISPEFRALIDDLYESAAHVREYTVYRRIKSARAVHADGILESIGLNARADSLQQ